jgi:hypothetical protein
METGIVIVRKKHLDDALLANLAFLRVITAVTLLPYTVVLPASLDFHSR